MSCRKCLRVRISSCFCWRCDRTVMIGIIVLNIGAIKMIVKVLENFGEGEGVRRRKIRASTRKAYTSTSILLSKA